jgi:hypothetical protein
LVADSPKLTIVANSEHQTGDGFALAETIRFGRLEFITVSFGDMSLSPEGNDSSVIFVGLVHSRSLSMHTILEESTNEGDTASNGGGSSGFPISQGCNMVTPSVPITTTPPSVGRLTNNRNHAYFCGLKL